MTRWTTALGLALMVAGGGAAAEGTCGDWVGDPAGHVAACDAELAATKDPAARVELLRDRGYALELDGQLDRAEVDYLEALRLRPSSAAVLADLAWLASARGDTAGRLARAEEAVAAAPEDGYAFNALAWALWEGERWEECLEVAARAVAADREDGSSASARASCLAGAGRDAEALLAFDQAEALGDDPAWIAASRSASLERLGRLDEALEAARGALEIDPGQAWALRNLLRLEFAQGRPDAAVEAYEAFLPGMGTEAADAEAVRNSLA
jgi:tetratricopeptide (TPR) repeat protein